MDDHEVQLVTRRLRFGDWVVDVRSTPPRQGPAVVLVHGIGVSGAYFLPFARVLAREYTVHMLDLPGYGSTPAPPRPLNVPELADATALAVHALGLERPVLVGQSMGCQIVTRAIATHRGLSRAYLLIGPTVDDEARTLVRLAARLARDVLHETPANNALVLRDYVRMGPVRFLRTSRAMLADRIEDSIVRCDLPGLIVRGARDPIAPARWVERLTDLAPDAATAAVPGAHNCQHTHPEALAAACAPFLRRVAGGKG